jgi:ATP-dependent helicase/nuclease subunit B
MTTIFTTLPGESTATIAAGHLLATLSREELPTALVIVPTRRACSFMRRAFLEQSGGETVLLPRVVALGDLEYELPHLVDDAARVAMLAQIPPAMPQWQRISLLTKQVMAFERQRKSHPLLEHSLTLARELASLQDDFASHGIMLSARDLQSLADGNDAEHWQQPLEFVSIISRHWPLIEAAYGRMTVASRQTRIQQFLVEYWRSSPPKTPVMLIGSTASLAPTAALMQVIADLPQGSVLLPGLDPRISEEQWKAVAEGHPYFHMKQFLAHWPVGLGELMLLGDERPPSIWLSALTPTTQVERWRAQSPIDQRVIAHLKRIECATDEEEARVVTVIIREGLEAKGTRIALVTPDEGFMGRVAAQLLRYGVVADRLSHSSLATTSAGSLWLALAMAVKEPARMLAQFALLRHPLVMQPHAADWQDWLNSSEHYVRGLVKQRIGQLPTMPDALQMHEYYPVAAKAIAMIADVSSAYLLVSQWIEQFAAILGHLQAGDGEGAAAVAELLESLSAADELGEIRIEAFFALLTEGFSEAWRGGLAHAHPGIIMLTPIEARMQQFDRMIIANLRDNLWPGIRQAGPWLNFTHQQKLGLPKPEESISLMAHDLLMLGSGAQVFLTHARRDAGSPVARSRFLERLLTLLAVHGIAEDALQAEHYRDWAKALDTADRYAPELPATPTPTASERAQEMNVSALDSLFSDPYRIYAEYILKLKPLNAFDELPEARDFGTIAHRAIEKLSEHWTQHARLATPEELSVFTDRALRSFSDRPNIMLFWHRRLLMALAFVNQQESMRRDQCKTVSNEQSIKQAIRFGEHALTLRGRIDRLEERADGTLVVSDYKTGAAATANDVVNGKAVQLLAYAMMLQTSAGVDYWGLPSGKRKGVINSVDAPAIADHRLLEKLRDALADFMNPATPLLAKPTANAERFQNPYDGISRYDEWAE